MAIVDCNVEQWTKLRNLRHLRFGICVSSNTLRAIANNLKHLQSIHFQSIHFEWRSVAGLQDLFRINNASLKALRLPMVESRGDSLRLVTLPYSLRYLHIHYGVNGSQNHELLELAASCCPQLCILVLPIWFSVSDLSLAKLAQFENLFYLRLCIDITQAALFGNALTKIGAKLRGLLLGYVDSRILHLIAEHCPLLEHCYINIAYRTPQEAEGQLLSGLKSLFQLAHLRSVSINYDCHHQLADQILDAINGLNAKGHLEYLHLCRDLSLPAAFVKNLIQLNPKLRKLACSIQDNHTPAELDKLKTLLQNMEGPLELELFREHCPPELETGKRSRIQVRKEYSPESISQPMLRQFWAQAMDSVPDLLDNFYDDHL